MTDDDQPQEDLATWDDLEARDRLIGFAVFAVMFLAFFAGIGWVRRRPWTR